MALVIAMMYLCNFLKIIVLCFCPFLFLFVLFNPVSVNWMEWSTMPACPSLYALLTGIILKRLPLQKCV